MLVESTLEGIYFMCKVSSELIHLKLIIPCGSGKGGKGGQSATPDSEKSAKNREKSGKYQEKEGKKEEKSGRKGKNREGSFTLPLLTNRAGYATALWNVYDKSSTGCV